jgi:curli biogenesis system outer membrane secretion channel CsgG
MLELKNKGPLLSGIFTVLIFILIVLISTLISGCGTTRTETYQADFEKKQSIATVSDYNGKQIPIQILSIGISDNVLTMYPILKEKNVGLGVTNIALDYLEGTNRFEFTEDKEEIKLKMVKQFQASKKGFTENKLDGKGKIKLAKYFVYIEVYDFSADEQETFVAGKKTLEVTTRLGLQVRFVDAESGEIKVGSGLGEATQYGQSFLKSLDMKFSQSTVGISTRKALETGCSRVITKMIKDGIFEK